MTPTTPAQQMRDYLRDRFAGCEDRENDSDSGTPHPDRETLENLSLAVELLDGLVACWYADEIESADLLAETAARRLFGWVACTTCGLLFPDLSGGLCLDCEDAAAEEDSTCTVCRGMDGVCEHCACRDDDAAADDLDSNPFGGALDR